MRNPPSRAAANGEASPQTFVIEELEALRKTFRAVCQRYVSRVEDEIVQLREQVIAGKRRQERLKKPGRAASGESAASAQTRDLRDMLMLLRALQLKPDASRRKDLKRVEAALADLRLLVEQWK